MTPVARRSRAAQESRTGAPTALRQGGAREIRFASYNIHLAIGRDGAFRPSRIATVIDELDADVVALQEISLGAPGFDMLAYLSKKCALSAIAGPTLMTTCLFAVLSNKR